MNRDRVRAECVENNQAKLVRFGASHGQPRVPKDDLTSAGTVSEKREVLFIVRNAADSRIDFVERPELPVSRIAAQGADTESDDRHLGCGRQLWQSGERLPEWPRPVVIGQRLSRAIGPLIL